MGRRTVLMVLMSQTCAHTASAVWDSSSAGMETVQVPRPCAMPARIVPMGLMKTTLSVSITGVSPTNGNVPTSAAFQRPGSVTQWMTAWITQTKTVHTAPAGPASLASSGVTMAAASRRAGSVTWTMIVETILMSPSMNA